MADYLAPSRRRRWGSPCSIDGAVVAKGFVEFSGRRPAEEDLRPHPAPGAAGSHDVEVSIDGDDFPARRPALGPPGAVARAAGAGHQRRRPHGLARGRGLLPGDGPARPATARTSVMTALPDDVAARARCSYNVVFLANVAEPSAAAGRRAGPLRPARGRAVPLGRHPGEHPRLERAAGRRCCRSRWRVPHRRRPARPGRRRDHRRPTGRAAGAARPPAPAAAAFPARGEGLASARFFKFLLLEPVPDTAQRGRSSCATRPAPPRWWRRPWARGG